MKATHIKDTPRSSPGHAAVYRLDKPVKYTKTYEGRSYKSTFVWVSTAQVCGRWETYAFPCVKSGKVKDWGELPGSSKGEINHSQILGKYGIHTRVSQGMKSYLLMVDAHPITRCRYSTTQAPIRRWRRCSGISARSTGT